MTKTNADNRDQSGQTAPKPATPLDMYQAVVAKLRAPEKRAAAIARTEEPDRLADAASFGNLAAAQRFLAEGADIATEGYKALVNAAENGHLPVVEFLINRGAHQFALIVDEDFLISKRLGTFDAAQERLGEALIAAARGGHADVVEYLVDQGADIAAQEYRAMGMAAAYGHLGLVQYFHERGAPISARDDSALCDAVFNGHLETTRYLLENGAKPAPHSARLLGYALYKNHYPLIALLIEKGADARMLEPIHMQQAVESGDPDIVRCLIENGAPAKLDDDMILRKAAAKDHLAVMDYLIEKGVPTDQMPSTMMNDYHEYKAQLQRWAKTVRQQPPAGIHDQDPSFFKGASYEFMKPLLAHEGYKDANGNKMAFAAAGLFQSPARIMQYLGVWGRQGKQPLHDVVQMIKLPETRGAMNIKDWGDAVLKLGPNMAKLAKFGDRLPSPARSVDGKTWSYQATRTLCAQFAYKNAHKHTGLAMLCFENNVDEDDFNDALRIVLRHKPADKNLPDILIDGEKFDMPGGKFYRLPAGDVRGLFLGELTDCCQSVGGHGDECARYGYKSENGGFYVVENAKGQVVSQTFAWRAQEGGMCFDTLETLGQNVTPVQWAKILQETAAELTQRRDHDLTQLSVGIGGGTPRDLRSVFKNAGHATPLDYDGYTEADEQIVVWQRKALTNTL